MMETDPKLVILVISNQINGQELFRVHVHELSIRFDDKFQEGIENNSELKREIDSLNHMWRNHKIEQDHIFPIMLDIMTRHVEYMKGFFFDENELDSSGQFIERPKTTTRPEAFFESLKQQKLLRKVTKKHFQSNIRSGAVAEEYVERYIPKSSYYHYQMYRTHPKKEDWFFMETDGRLNLCFLNK